MSGSTVMSNVVRPALVSAMLVLASAWTFIAHAHHSFSAVFDIERPVELTGVVTRVAWRNPHVWFYVDVVNDDEATDNWAFELGSPNALIRRGWSHRSLKPGDRVTIRGARARDDSQRAAVLSVTLSSGQNLFGAQRPGR